MLTDHDNIIRGLAAVLASQTPLTPVQAAALRARLDADPMGRGYKDAQGAFRPVADLLTLLNQPFGVDNPVAQERVPLASIAKPALLVLATTLQARHAGMLLAGQSLPAGIAYIVDTLVPQAAAQDSLSLDAPGAPGMIAALGQSGMLTQADADALTTQPDPAWTPTVLHPSEAETLFGPGAVLERSDVAAALALGA